MATLTCAAVLSCTTFESFVSQSKENIKSKLFFILHKDTKNSIFINEKLKYFK